MVFCLVAIGVVMYNMNKDRKHYRHGSSSKRRNSRTVPSEKLSLSKQITAAKQAIVEAELALTTMQKQKDKAELAFTTLQKQKDEAEPKKGWWFW